MVTAARLEEAGLAFDPSLVLTAENTMAGGSKAIEQLLNSGTQRPTAAFMYNDQMAVGALHALRLHRTERSSRVRRGGV